MASTEGDSSSASSPSSASASDYDRGALVKLASEHDNFGQFLAAAMKQQPGVEDSELAVDLLNEDAIFAEGHQQD